MIQFNLEATNCLKTPKRIRKYYIFLFWAANNVYSEQKSVQLSAEDDCSVRESNTLSLISVVLVDGRVLSLSNFWCLLCPAHRVGALSFKRWCASDVCLSCHMSTCRGRGHIVAASRTAVVQQLHTIVAYNFFSPLNVRYTCTYTGQSSTLIQLLILALKQQLCR